MSKQPNTSLQTVSEAFASMKRHPVSMAGVNGYFLDKKEVTQLCEEVECLLESGDCPEVNELLDLRVKLEDSLKTCCMWEGRLSASETECARMRTELDETKEALSVATGKKEKYLADIRTESDQLRAELKAAKEAKNTLRKTLKESTDAKFDPDVAKKLGEEEQCVKDHIAATTKKLEEVNRQKATLDKAVNEANRSVKERQAALTEKSAAVAAIKSAFAAAESDLPPPPAVVVNSTAVRNLLGDKGLKWVQKASDAVHTDARDRAYKLMLAFKGASKDRTLKGFFDLLELVYQWVKTRAYNVRLQIIPWLDELSADLAAGALKHLSHYRKQLEEIVGKLVKAAQKGSAQVARSAEVAWNTTRSTTTSFFDEVWAWTQVIYLRTMKRPAKRFGKWIASTYSSLKSWFFPKVENLLPQEGEIIFDAGDFSIDAKLRKSGTVEDEEELTLRHPDPMPD